MIRFAIRAFRRGYELGQARAHAEDIAWLRKQADLHRGGPSDQRRRGALNHAATAILQRKPPSRPNAGECS